MFSYEPILIDAQFVFIIGILALDFLSEIAENGNLLIRFDVVNELERDEGFHGDGFGKPKEGIVSRGCTFFNEFLRNIPAQSFYIC